MTDKGNGSWWSTTTALVLAFTLTHGPAQAGYEVIDADNGDDAILLRASTSPTWRC